MNTRLPLTDHKIRDGHRSLLMMHEEMGGTAEANPGKSTQDPCCQLSPDVIFYRQELERKLHMHSLMIGIVKYAIREGLIAIDK